MGQSASSNKKVRKQKDSLSSHPTTNAPTVAGSSQNETQDLSKFCKKVQNRKYAGLKSEFDTDIQEFVLNNLLMCIDLFDDFERAKEEADSFKIEKEAELNHSHEDISTKNRMIQRQLIGVFSKDQAENSVYHQQ